MFVEFYTGRCEIGADGFVGPVNARERDVW